MMSIRRLWSWIVGSFVIAVVPFWLVACSSGGGDVGTTGQRPAASALKALETVTAPSPTLASSPPALDGAVSFATATATVSTISFAHTTGSGADRLTLVGIAANNYSTSRTISSVTFTPLGGSATALSSVGSVQNGNGRLAAIYSLLAPPGGVSGTMAVKFSGSVGYGIVAGAANFKGVDQAMPLDNFASSTSTTTTVSLSVPSHDGALVFDTVFLGAQTLPTVTAGAAQSPLWNSSASRTLGAVSTKAASSSTTTMSWTATAASNWAVGGVSINPSGGGGPVTPDFSILLGRPTNASITANIIPNHNGECFIEYGTSPGTYTAGQTGTFACTTNVPVEVVVDGLSAHTQYYYRLQFKASSSTVWAAGAEHSFWTQRAQGNSFTFTVTSDSHESFTATEQNAMTNIANEHPDFEIDLGDTFITDNLTSQSAVNSHYLAYRQPSYFDQFSHSAPIFLSSGNHENEEGWNLDDTPLSLAQASIQARKLYYPTPINGGFYSGNTDPLASIDPGTYGDQYREDYYAWTWGDALFVVIDPFQYTMNLPYAPAAGEGGDDAKTGDQWSWTLGAQQYNWLKTTLQNSTAKYKFMFSHQMVGGIPRGPFGGAEAGYVRGGAEAAAYFEWGGDNADGTAGFAAHRDAAVFGTKPIHQLMKDCGVSAYFHGHDHQYVYETRDGIVYQEVPSPGTAANSFSGVYAEGDHGTYNTIKMLSNSGHLRIAVAPTQATVDYISAATTSGTVNYSYTIAPNAGPSPPSAPTSVTASDGTYTDKVQVSWTASTGATSYQVYRNTSSSSSGATQIGTPTASPYDDTGATPGTTYYYFVKACNGAVCSDFSVSDSGYCATTPSVDGGSDAGPGEDAATCQCEGLGPGGVAVTAECGQSVCGTDYSTYACNANGWSATGQSCTADAGAPDAGATPDAKATPVFVTSGGGRGPLSTTIVTDHTFVDTVPKVNNRTMRVMLRTTAGGSQVAVKLTNRFSSVALPVGAAHVAIQSTGSTIVPGSDRTLTFSSSGAVTIPANAEVWSDPAGLSVSRGQTLAISVHVTGNLTPTTESGRGNLSWMTHYLSSTGNHTSDLTLSGATTTHIILFVAEVRVLPATPAVTIVTLGDSITEGASSSAPNGDWPDLLSDRLPTLSDGTPVSVFNAGIGSGRFQSSDGAGLSGIKRLPELLALPGVRWVTILMGVNDISYDGATVANLEDAYRSAINLAHAAGVKVIGIPILPFRHSVKDDAQGKNWATAKTVNGWIRTSGSFDAVIDFEPIVGDPNDPGSMKSTLQSGDHVHPNQKGYNAMANSIDLSIFH